MKKCMLKIILVLTIFIINIPVVKAEKCSKEKYEELLGMANSVKISYLYNEDYEKKDEPVYGSFKVTITGLTDKLYIIDNSSRKIYGISSAKDGVLTFDVGGGSRTFDICSYNVECDEILLKSTIVNIPKFNYYAVSDKCKGIDAEKFNLCGKWYQFEIDSLDFKEKLNAYKKSENIVDDKKIDNNDVIVNIDSKDYTPYYIITGISVAVIILIVIIVIKGNRSKLK